MQTNTVTNSKPLSFKGKLGLTGFLLIFISIGCVPLWWGVQGVREVRESNSWPTVPGKVTGSHVAHTTSKTRDRDRNNREQTTHSYSAQIEYEFEVNGLKQTGTRITIVSEQIGDQAQAEAISKRYEIGTEVVVSYKPGDPSESVLEPGRWGGTIFMFGFAAAFILLPLGFLRIIWQPGAVNTDLHPHTKAERQRFGLEFRERFIEWEPGNLIHLHRDHLGFIKVLAGAAIAGLIGGAIFGAAPAFYFFSARGNAFVFQVYLVVSGVLAVVGAVWLGLDNRRRDTVIDWGRETVRAQVGWFASEYTFDEIRDVTLQIPQPTKLDTNNSDGVTKAYAARVRLRVGGKNYIVLEVECDRDDLKRARKQLQPIAEQLASSLKVPLV